MHTLHRSLTDIRTTAVAIYLQLPLPIQKRFLSIDFQLSIQTVVDYPPRLEVARLGFQIGDVRDAFVPCGDDTLMRMMRSMDGLIRDCDFRSLSWHS